MVDLTEMKKLLGHLQVPKQQQSDMCGYAMLAILKLTPEKTWKDASNEWIRIHDIIGHTKDNYGYTYAENSRETIRKQAMHAFRNAAFIEDNGVATNSPNYRYRATAEFLDLIHKYSTQEWDEGLKTFLTTHESLVSKYASKKKMARMPVKINGEDFTFSPGAHNKLQKAIIEEFAPRFAPNCICLYVGDSDKRDLVKNKEKLAELGMEITDHDKMPDVVLYREEQDWIYFIESVTSVGPMNPKRILEIKEMTKNVKSGLIFVTAFPDVKTYKKFAEDLAWETEVWLSDLPDHMIHLNGDRFIGPRT